MMTMKRKKPSHRQTKKTKMNKWQFDKRRNNWCDGPRIDKKCCHQNDPPCRKGRMIKTGIPGKDAYYLSQSILFLTRILFCVSLCENSKEPYPPFSARSPRPGKLCWEQATLLHCMPNSSSLQSFIQLEPRLLLVVVHCSCVHTGLCAA